MEFPARKPNRLPNYDYSQVGVYHITICTKDKCGFLSSIVPGNVFSPPTSNLTELGFLVEKYIQSMNQTYPEITVDKYTIMPNHVHLLISIHSPCEKQTSRSNERIPFLVSTLKRLSNRESGVELWQRGYFDHVIRNRQDYQTVWQYIDDNPAKWIYDDYYIRG